MEPFRTMKLFPWRFILGIPIVLFVSISISLCLVPVNFGFAIGLQIGLQTLGFLWLYVPANRQAMNK